MVLDCVNWMSSHQSTVKNRVVLRTKSLPTAGIKLDNFQITSQHIQYAIDAYIDAYSMC